MFQLPGLLHVNIVKTLSFGILYLGPDSIVPLASILAAAIGVILLFWRYIKKIIIMMYNRIRGRHPEETPEALVDPDADNDPKEPQ